MIYSEWDNILLRSLQIIAEENEFVKYNLLYCDISMAMQGKFLRKL